MKVNGIVAEYNPFHNGHKYQLEESLRLTGADFTVVAMSGNFVQRGAPALTDKRLRTEMALRCGADLVLELPVLYAAASSEYFAAGAVALLDKLGVVTHLCFGSECGDAAALGQIAAYLADEPEEYRAMLKQFLKQGLSYPDARARALAMQAGLLKDCSNPVPEQGDCTEITEKFPHELRPEPSEFPKDSKDASLFTTQFSQKENVSHSSQIQFPQKGDEMHSSRTQFSQKGDKPHFDQTHLPDNCEELLSSPNNILGIDYIKEIIRRKSGLIPVTVKRIGSGYHDLSMQEASPISALAIRQKLYEGQKPDQLRFFLPEEARTLLDAYLAKNKPLYPNALSGLLYYKLLLEKEQGYEKYLDVSTDLSNRIRNSLNGFTGFGSFCDLLKTKTITHTRISRSLLHILLGIEKEAMIQGKAQDYAPYARVLGFRRTAEPLLNAIKTHSAIPLITKLSSAQKSLPEEADRLLKLDLFASEVYKGVVYDGTGQPAPNEFSTPLVIL